MRRIHINICDEYDIKNDKNKNPFSNKSYIQWKCWDKNDIEIKTDI